MSIASPLGLLKDRGDGFEVGVEGRDGCASCLRIIEAAGGRWGFPCRAACCAARSSEMVGIGWEWMESGGPFTWRSDLESSPSAGSATHDGPSVRPYG